LTAFDKILDLLPYSPPFLFVDELFEVNEKGVRGAYTFPENSFFYEGHFKCNPVTPGVILTECMAQIGVVSLGIFLLKKEAVVDLNLSLTSTSVNFFLPVSPGERVEVTSEKVYFRFSKLKCRVEMKNGKGQLICRGEISGMLGKKRGEV
jgi:3-hydroxyacyl-[acyl-carrier-protein] dehydratase